VSIIGKGAALFVGGTLVYGLVTGQLDLGTIGDHTTISPIAAKKASAVAGIPGTYLNLYRSAADTCPHLDWALLAGVGWVESKHGTDKARGVASGSNSAGAMGPMQFLAGTWREVRGKHPGIGSNVYDPAHAIPATAHKLCDDGVRAGNTDQALRRYNNSSKYVRTVEAKAAEYRKLR
jgi:soluble lytic murein transglycosylase-like protein